MQAQDQIKKDITEYCELNNCTVTEAVNRLSPLLPYVMKEELSREELPPIIHAWQALQFQDLTHMQYHKSKALGEFIFNTDMYHIETHKGILILKYNHEFVGDLELPDGCINTSCMFKGYVLPEGFTLGDKFDTSKVINMTSMFALVKLPKGFTLGDNFDTSNVEEMGQMFSLSRFPNGFTLGDKFDTSKVIGMEKMFYECTLPEGFTLGDKFNTAKAENMRGMFEDCTLPDGTDATHMTPLDVIDKLKECKPVHNLGVVKEYPYPAEIKKTLDADVNKYLERNGMSFDEAYEELYPHNSFAAQQRYETLPTRLVMLWQMIQDKTYTGLYYIPLKDHQDVIVHSGDPNFGKLTEEALDYRPSYMR